LDWIIDFKVRKHPLSFQPTLVSRFSALDYSSITLDLSLLLQFYFYPCMFPIVNLPLSAFWISGVAPDIAAALKKNHRSWKKNRFLASCSFRENVLFKESPPSIMVTRNPNWSTEILWYGTGYVKGKILSPLKHSA